MTNNKKIIKTQMAELWLDNEGILHIYNLEGANPDLVQAKETIQAIKNFGLEKRPILVDISKIRSVTREAREYFSGTEAAERATGLAVIINSPVAKVIGNFLIGINKPDYPIKLFSSENEAIEWLKNYVAKEDNQ